MKSMGIQEIFIIDNIGLMTDLDSFIKFRYFDEENKDGQGLYSVLTRRSWEDSLCSEGGRTTVSEEAYMFNIFIDNICFLHPMIVYSKETIRMCLLAQVTQRDFCNIFISQTSPSHVRTYYSTWVHLWVCSLWIICVRNIYFTAVILALIDFHAVIKRKY